MLRMSKKSKTEASSDICSLKKPIFYFVNLGEVAYEIGLRQGLRNTVQKLSVKYQPGLSLSTMKCLDSVINTQ